MVRRALLILVLLVSGASLFSQQFTVISGDGALYRVNPEDCSASFLVYSASMTDITYTPDGQLWGIALFGQLLRINENNGQFVTEHAFPSAYFYTALVAAPDGRIFTATDLGRLYSYDPATGTETFHGMIGYGSAGDLTFYQGQMIMASTGNSMVVVDIDNPPDSYVLMNFNVGGEIFGIVTYVTDCINTVTYASNDNDRGGLFQVDFTTQELTLICEFNFNIFGAASELEFLAASPVLIDAIEVTPTDCISPQGAIAVSASGGNGDLYYSLDGVNFQQSNIFNNLPAGNYTVYVEDQEGCMASDAVAIPSLGDPPVIVNTTLEPASCGLANGALLLTAGNGSPPYDYSIGPMGPYGPEPGFSGLPAGPHLIWVRDARGCTDSMTVELPGSPAVVIASVTELSCGPGAGRLDVQAAGGTGSLSYSLNGGAGQAVNTFAMLQPGFYEIVVMDETGCMANASATVPDVSPLVLELLESKACGEGESAFSVRASGGNGGYQYRLAGGSLQPGGLFEGLSSGLYQPEVVDAAGCVSQPFPVNIKAAEKLRFSTIDITPGQCLESNGAISAQVEGGNPPFLFSLNDLEQPFGTFSGLPAGAYLLAAVDEQGCSLADSVKVASICPIYLPNAFSPNGDGRNDRFLLFSGLEVQIRSFRIFNRWGGMVYGKQAFSSSDTALFWDGTHQGQPAPAGIYAYYVELINASGEEEFHEGEVMLVR